MGTKTKQDVVVADETAKSTVTLWENDVNSLKQGKSYQLNRLEVRMYMGKKHLSFPSLSKDEISNIDVIDSYTSSSDEDEEQLQCVSVSGIRELQSFHQCIHCYKSVKSSSSNIGTCETCNTMQKLSEPTLSARLVIHAEHQKLVLKASDVILKTIAQSQTITPQDLLFAPMFHCTYNNNNFSVPPLTELPLVVMIHRFLITLGAHAQRWYSSWFVCTACVFLVYEHVPCPRTYACVMLPTCP